MPKLSTALGYLLGSFVLIGILSAVRPAAPSRMTKRPPIGTIHFVEADQKRGLLSGTYEYQGYTISFRAIRGERNPWLMLLLDPQAPHYATDALLCDMEHFCFGIQAGGHAFTHEELLVNQHPELLTENRAFRNQLTSWALHQDMMRFDDNQYPGLHEQLNSIRWLSDVPFPPRLAMPTSTRE